MLVFKKRRKIREMATITFVWDEIVVKKFSLEYMSISHNNGVWFHFTGEVFDKRVSIGTIGSSSRYHQVHSLTKHFLVSNVNPFDF